LKRPILWLIVAAVLLGAGWVWWLCRWDDSIPFLPAERGGQWIVYPKPPDTTPHPAIALWAHFRHSFTLAATPTHADLLVRTFRQGTVRVNGRLVDEVVLGEKDWKRARTCDVASYLKAGANEISVTVSNSLGPPALWLSLKSDTLALQTDTEWQVSLLGAVWQNAALASKPPPIRRGNPLYGRERVVDSLRRAWPQLLLILAVAAMAVVGAGRLVRRAASRSNEGKGSTLAPITVLGLMIVAWIVLFANNLPQLPALLGFDRDGHQQYIDYILQHKALPLADEGWQMYQPPLYYLLAASLIGTFGWSASADAALLSLRAVAALTGIIQLLLVFLCLRLLFANRPRLQVVGLLVAGFLPMNLCLSHHITNEGLAALFVTAALYFTLRLLRSEERGTGLAIGAGVCLGLAMLTKFSALLAIPLVLAALAWRAIVPAASQSGPGAGLSRNSGLGRIALVAGACLAVCGWHYARVWYRFGTPLIGNWDPRLQFAWWQDPGCHTGGWYWRFGQALVCPLFSSIAGFADGVYSTLWGDGLCSGSAIMHFRPQWNYDLMNIGYLLSLVITVLLLAGFIVAVIRFLRQPTPEWFLLLGLAFAFAAGVGLMSLRVASYAQVKAFYALPALLPICAAAALGWDWLVGKRSGLRPVMWFGLVAWGITVCCAFWIRSWDSFTYTARGIGLADDGRYSEAADNFSRSLQLETNAVTARIQLAEALRRLGRNEEAHQQLSLAEQQHPERAEVNTEAALMLSLERHYAEAVRYLKRAVAEAPDHPTAYQQLAACLALMQQPKQVIEACQQGLRIDPFNPTLHHTLALAAAETGDPTNAVAHLQLALALKPNWPEARGLLAVLLVSLGRNEAAAEQYKQAIREKPDDAKLRYLYAVTLGSLGDIRQAVDQYRQALGLQPDMVEALNNLAWILASSPADDIRDGKEAVRLAERACDLSGQREPMLLGTLAAAYAEAGRFDDAIKTAQKARDLATAAGLKHVAEKNSQLLELYRVGRPYHETAAGNL